MAESYFNRDQETHIEALGRIPRRERCASGWHRAGECGDRPCKPMPWTVCLDCGEMRHFLCAADTGGDVR